MRQIFMNETRIIDCDTSSEWREFENEQHVAAPPFSSLSPRHLLSRRNRLETSHYLFQRAWRASIFHPPDTEETLEFTRVVESDANFVWLAKKDD